MIIFLCFFNCMCVIFFKSVLSIISLRNAFQADTHLVFPKSASVEQLKLIRESIATERDQRLSRGQMVPPTSQTAVASVSSQGSSAAAAAAVNTSRPRVTPAPSQPPSLVRKNSSSNNLYEYPCSGFCVLFVQN